MFSGSISPPPHERDVTRRSLATEKRNGVLVEGVRGLDQSLPLPSLFERGQIRLKSELADSIRGVDGDVGWDWAQGRKETSD